jgi:hypothetical protein
MNINAFPPGPIAFQGAFEIFFICAIINRNPKSSWIWEEGHGTGCVRETYLRRIIKCHAKYPHLKN